MRQSKRFCFLLAAFAIVMVARLARERRKKG